MAGRCSRALRWLPYRKAWFNSVLATTAHTGTPPVTIVISPSTILKPFMSPKYFRILPGSVGHPGQISVRFLHPG